MVERSDGIMKKGRFTVSALIFDNDNRLLLFKDSSGSVPGGLKQPGMYYDPSTEGLTPFEKAIDSVRHELGLEIVVDFDMITPSLSKIRRQTTIRDIIDSESGFSGDKAGLYKEYLDNEIVPPPFLITKEYDYGAHGQKNDSSFRIDMYYFFRLKVKSNIAELIREKNNYVTDVVMYGRRDLVKFIDKVAYKDLIYAYDHFVDMMNRGAVKPKIKTCTFSRGRNNSNVDLLCWRITNSCNSRCEYCFVHDKKLVGEQVDSGISPEVIDKCFNIFRENNIKKIIISGGEPFLVDNLISILQGLETISTCEEYSICTNGSIPEHSFFSSISMLSKLKKITISLDGYNKHIFEQYKKGIQFDNVKKFIKKCVDMGIPFSVNVVANNDFMKNIESYVRFWKKNGIKDVSISCAIGDSGELEKSSMFTNRIGLVQKYLEIYTNEYGDISFLDNIELILPECQRNCSDHDILFLLSNGEKVSCPEFIGPSL